MSAPSDSSAATFSDREQARGRWLVIGATVFWGTSATLARHVFRDHQVPALTAVELRLLIACALLGPWLAWRRPELLRVRRADWGYFLVLGLFGVAAVQGTYYYAISVLGVGLAILIQYVAPALIVAYDAVRGARVRGQTVLAVAAALLGTGLLVGNLDPATLQARPIEARPLHWIVGFGSAFAFAFYVIYSKRGLVRYAPVTLLFYTFLIACVFWAFVTPPWRVIAAGYGADLWTMFLALGVFSTLVPFVLFNAGLRRLPHAQAGILATVEPVVAVISAGVFLGETLHALQWLGGIFVLAASILASRQAPEVIPAQAERA